MIRFRGRFAKLGLAVEATTEAGIRAELAHLGEFDLVHRGAEIRVVPAVRGADHPTDTTTVPTGTYTNPPKGPQAATSHTDLRNIQQAKLLYAISEGPVGGLMHSAYGLKDVCLNDVPVQNPDGSFNFNGIAVSMTGGTLTQAVIPGFSDSESLSSSGAQILTTSPQVISITNPAADAVRVNVSMPACKSVGGDGSIDGSIVDLKFEVSTNGGSYVDVTNLLPSTYNGATIPPGRIIGRSDGPYVAGYRIPLPTGTSWTVRVSRITADTPSGPFNTTYLQSWSVIVEQQLRYPATALLGLMLDASRFSSMPKVSVALRGVKIKVPTNYTPASYKAFSLGSAVPATLAITVNAAAKTFTRASGSFLTDGFVKGQTVVASGFTSAGNNTGNASGNNRGLVITDLTATVMTFGSSTTLVNEASGSRTITTNWPPSVAVDGTAKTFTRLVGSFLVDGFAVGQTILTTGFTNGGNNGTFVITSCTATVITCAGATGLVTEATSTGRSITTGWIPASYATTGPGTSLGTWDGSSYKTVFCNNPAWVFYDLATNPRYGAGRYLSASAVDKWGLYAIAQVCDAMVSDGMGGLEPRFVFNGYLTQADEAFKMLTNVLSSARAQLYYANGMVTPVQDVDATPAALFTPSNVKDGRFVYQGTARKARHTVASVTWQDPARLYSAVSEPVQADDITLARYGIQTTNPVAVGSTSIGQTRRFGRWTILTEQNCVEAVNFTTALKGLVVRVGNVILVQDPGRARARMGGRIVSATASTVTLDAPVTLLAGQTYVLWAELPSGAVTSQTVTNTAGTYSTLNLAASFSTNPNPQAQWLLSSSSQAATRWRIVSIKEAQSTTAKEYSIVAVQQVPAIYALADATDSVVPRVATIQSFAPVTGLAATAATSWKQGNLTLSISATWTAPTGATSYQADIQRGNGTWAPMKVSGCSAIFESAVPAVYQIRVYAIYPNGLSQATVCTLNAGGITLTAPATVTLTESVTCPAAVPGERRQVEGEQITAPGLISGQPTLFLPVYLTQRQTYVDTVNASSLLAGFQVVFTTSTDPTDTSKYLMSPINLSSGEIGCTVAYTPLANQTVYAAVRTQFTTGDVSNWTVSTGAAVLAVTLTLPDNGVNDPNVLSPADKANLISAWNSEIAQQITLDASSGALAVSHAAYDNAITALSVGLIAYGAPANWATTWPDSTKLLHAGIKAALASWWSSIATQRVALINAISQAQSNAGQAAAIATSASAALALANAAGLQSPAVASWASTARPALPNGTYPAGSCWVTTDGLEYQVSPNGSTWNKVTVAATALFGQVLASQIVVANLGNLIPNPNSNQVAPPGGWPAGAWETAALSSGMDSPYGGYGLRLISGTGVFQIVDLTAPIPCKPGDVFNFYAGLTADWGVADHGQLLISYYDTLAHAAAKSSVDYAMSGDTGGSWAPLSVTRAAPAGAQYVVFSLCNTQAIGHEARFTGLLARQCSDASVIVDGTLTTLFARYGNWLASTNNNHALVSSTVPPVGVYMSGQQFTTVYTENTYTAGTFIVGQQYRVVSAGTTTWASCGGSWIGTVGAVGSIFTATAAGSGTGTANHCATDCIMELGGSVNLQGYQLGQLGVAKLWLSSSSNGVAYFATCNTPGSDAAWSWTAPKMGVTGTPYWVEVTAQEAGQGGMRGQGGGAGSCVTFRLLVQDGTVLSGRVSGGGLAGTASAPALPLDTTVAISGTNISGLSGTILTLHHTVEGDSALVSGAYFYQVVTGVNSPALSSAGPNSMVTSGAGGGSGNGAIGGGCNGWAGGAQYSTGCGGGASAFGPGGAGATTTTANASAPPAFAYGAGGGGSCSGTGGTGGQGNPGCIQIRFL